MNKSISIKSIYTIIISFIFFHILFVNFPYLNNYNELKYIFIIIMLPFLITKLPLLTKSVEKRIIFLIALYFILVMISSFVSIFNNVVISSIIYLTTIFELLLFVLWLSKNNLLKKMFRVFLYLSVIYLIINDCLILYSPSMFMSKGEFYLIGNKFSVSYMHFEAIIFYMICKKIELIENKRKKSWLLIIIYIIVSFIIANKIDCMTGVIGILIICLLNELPTKLLINNKLFVIVSVCSCAFVFAYPKIINNESLQNILTNHLNRSITLTGRTFIYDNVPRVLKDNVLLGYGYGKSYDVWIKTINMPNSQNGIINNIVEVGIIATTILFMIFYNIFSIVKQSQIKEEIIKPILIIIYTYLILSTIEITIGLPFISFAIFLYGISKGTKNEVINNES